MNVLLIAPPISRHYDTPKFPLGLGYIAAVLLRAGHEVQVLDTNALRLSDSEIERFLKDAPFDLVGLSGFIPHYEEVKWPAQMVRRYSSAPIVVGGGLASAAPEIVLQDMPVNVAVVGEGESVMLEVASAFGQGTDLRHIKGIWYREGDDFLSTGPREGIEHLSSMPFPAWDLFPLKYYLNTPASLFRVPKMSMITSRGCPYRCSFCFHGIFGHRYRARTVEDVVEEICVLQTNYGVQAIMFEDDTFTLRKSWVHELCDELIKRRIKVLWSCNGRANLVDRDLLRHMRAAGCVAISYGVESGNQAMLDRINKGTTIAQNRKAIELTWEAGMIPHAFVMIGIPGETAETIAESVRFCQEAGVLAEFSITTPIPGSALYQEALDAGKIASKRDLVANWGYWLDEVIVNMTNMQDAELIVAKRKSEKDVVNYVARHHKRLMLKMLCIWLRINGPLDLIRRLIGAVRLMVRVNMNRGLSGRLSRVSTAQVRK